MTEQQKESYNNITSYLKKETKIVTPKRPLIRGILGDVESPLSEREIYWNNLAQGIYVLTSDYNEKFFNEESKEHGFYDLLTKVYISHHLDIPHEYDTDLEILKEWFYENGVKTESEYKIALQSIACHTSHCIVSEHFLKTKGERLMVFENDCKFNRYVSNSFLDELKTIIINEDIGYFHLGWELPVWDIREKKLSENGSLEIHKLSINTTYAHSYILNRHEAQKFVNTMDVTNKVPFIKDSERENIKEFIYRSQADDYFTYFVDGYCLDKSLTYQQKIGPNKEQGFKHV